MNRRSLQTLTALAVITATNLVLAQPGAGTPPQAAALEEVDGLPATLSAEARISGRRIALDVAADACSLPDTRSPEATALPDYEISLVVVRIGH